MTQAEALHILNLCKRHELPRPKRRPSGGEYELRWATQVVTAHCRSFDAAIHLCRFMYKEKKGRSMV